MSEFQGLKRAEMGAGAEVQNSQRPVLCIVAIAKARNGIEASLGVLPDSREALDWRNEVPGACFFETRPSSQDLYLPRLPRGAAKPPRVRQAVGRTGGSNLPGSFVNHSHIHPDRANQIRRGLGAWASSPVLPLFYSATTSGVERTNDHFLGLISLWREGAVRHEPRESKEIELVLIPKFPRLSYVTPPGLRHERMGAAATLGVLLPARALACEACFAVKDNRSPMPFDISSQIGRVLGAWASSPSKSPLVFKCSRQQGIASGFCDTLRGRGNGTAFRGSAVRLHQRFDEPSTTRLRAMIPAGSGRESLDSEPGITSGSSYRLKAAHPLSLDFARARQSSSPWGSSVVSFNSNGLDCDLGSSTGLINQSFGDVPPMESSVVSYRSKGLDLFNTCPTGAARTVVRSRIDGSHFLPSYSAGPIDESLDNAPPFGEVAGRSFLDFRDHMIDPTEGVDLLGSTSRSEARRGLGAWASSPNRRLFFSTTNCVVKRDSSLVTGQSPPVPLPPRGRFVGWPEVGIVVVREFEGSSRPDPGEPAEARNAAKEGGVTARSQVVETFLSPSEMNGEDPWKGHRRLDSEEQGDPVVTTATLISNRIGRTMTPNPDLQKLLTK